MRIVTLCLAVSALAVSAVALAAVKTKRPAVREEEMEPALPVAPPLPPVARVLPERYPLRFSTN